MTRPALKLTAPIAAPPRLKLTALEPTEDQFHEAVADFLKVGVMPPAEWTGFPAGWIKLAPDQAAKLIRMGLKRNWPDFQLLHDGTMHGLELKRRGEKLSRSRWVRRTVGRRKGEMRWVEGQADVFPRLESAGMRIAVCETMEQVIVALQRWRIPLRRGLAL